MISVLDRRCLTGPVQLVMDAVGRNGASLIAQPGNGAGHQNHPEAVGSRGFFIAMFLHCDADNRYSQDAAQAAANLRTSTGSRLCCVCQRSYCNCCVSQLSGLPPNASDSRMAISGDMPRRPLSSRESVLRDTASPLRRFGDRQAEGIEALAPDEGAGMGRVVHEHGRCLSLMVVQIVDIGGVAVLEAEDRAPVGAHRHRPEPGIFPLQPVEPEAGQVHVVRDARRIESDQDVAHGLAVLRVDAPFVGRVP